MLTRTNIGTTPDGRPLYHYAQDDSTAPVVLTGPATGVVTTSDGTDYNVTEPVIEVDPSHTGEVAHLIGVQIEDEGHPSHTDGTPFAHTCTDDCGELSRG